MPTSRRTRTAATPTDPAPEATEASGASGASVAGAGGRRRSRARKGEGRRLRDEILAATEELLVVTGSAEAVSIRAVADAVGVTPPSIYRHFPDKTTLIYEVCARHFARLDAEIDAAVEGIEHPMDALKARGTAYIEFGRNNPEPYRIMFMVRPEQGPAGAAQEEWIRDSRTFADVVANVQACIDLGAFRPDYDDALLATLGFWARVHGLVSLMVSKPLLPWSSDEFIDQYMEACIYGVGHALSEAHLSEAHLSDGSADQSRSGDR